jgi:hypothetical protein
MIGAAAAAPRLTDLKREIRRLHGCDSAFERFVALPETPGRSRRVVAVFALSAHPAQRCYAWLEAAAGGPGVVAVLHGIEAGGPEQAVQHVARVESAAQERWAQEYE